MPEEHAISAKQQIASRQKEENPATSQSLSNMLFQQSMALSQIPK